MNYETGHLTFSQANKFCKEFDAKIGTERELNNIDIDTYYVCCFELETMAEVNNCIKIETNSLCA